MGDILGWQPFVWTARIALLILVGGTGYVFLLFLIRFLNWKNIKGMARASLPEVESVAGEFAGARAEVRLVAQGRQLNFIEQRVTDLEENHATLVDAMKQMRKKKGLGEWTASTNCSRKRRLTSPGETGYGVCTRSGNA